MTVSMSETPLFGDKPNMYAVHDVPGRLRVKFHQMKNNPHRLEQIKALLEVEGVHKIKSNALTGSVVVEYDSLAMDSQHLIQILNENGYAIDKGHHIFNKKSDEPHEKIAKTIGKATVTWIAGRVLEANGLSYIAAFI